MEALCSFSVPHRRYVVSTVYLLNRVRLYSVQYHFVIFFYLNLINDDFFSFSDLLITSDFITDIYIFVLFLFVYHNLFLYTMYVFWCESECI